MIFVVVKLEVCTSVVVEVEFVDNVDVRVEFVVTSWIAVDVTVLLTDDVIVERSVSVEVLVIIETSVVVVEVVIDGGIKAREKGNLPANGTNALKIKNSMTIISSSFVFAPILALPLPPPFFQSRSSAERLLMAILILWHQIISLFA
jgi:hypothetical protein